MITGHFHALLKAVVRKAVKLLGYFLLIAAYINTNTLVNVMAEPKPLRKFA